MRTRKGHEKFLVFCPAISTETLLHFNRQGDSYRLRSFVGALAGRTWMQPDAPTSSDFLRLYPPVHQIDVTSERISLKLTDRWHAIITQYNRRFGIPSQRSVERHTFTAMDEQQRLLADAVERIAGGCRPDESFTMRELVILSPYARERSPAGQATDARLTSRLGTAHSGSAIEDRTRIRWGTIHEFKGLEAPAVILTDVDLSKGYHRDLLYVGASRATDRLVVLKNRATRLE